MLRLFFIFTLTYIERCSVLAGEEMKCDLRDLRTLFVKISTTETSVNAKIEEQKKSFNSELLFLNQKITQQRKIISVLESENSETTRQINDLVQDITNDLKEKKEIMKQLDELVQNMTGLASQNIATAKLIDEFVQNLTSLNTNNTETVKRLDNIDRQMEDFELKQVEASNRMDYVAQNITVIESKHTASINRLDEMAVNITYALNKNNRESSERLNEIVQNITNIEAWHTEIRSTLTEYVENMTNLIEEENRKTVRRLDEIVQNMTVIDTRQNKTSKQVDDIFKNMTRVEAKYTEMSETLSEIILNVTSIVDEKSQEVADRLDDMAKNMTKFGTTLYTLLRKIETDDCIGHLCQNGATCVDGIDNYTCDCRAEFTGVHCSTRLTVPYYGTQFVTGFFNTTGNLTLMFGSLEDSAVITVSIPSMNLTNEQHVLVDNTLTLKYPLTVSNGSRSGYSVYVTAERPVELFAGNIELYRDVTLIPPETLLGTEYVVPGYPFSLAGTEEILIVGTSDNTNITITNGPVSDTFLLNRIQTYFRASQNISGTMILASAPVFVLYGHRCFNIPNCGHIEEVVPPTKSLGTVHVISFMKPKPDFTIGIIAPEAHTSVLIYDNDGIPVETLNLSSTKQAIFRAYTPNRTISVVSNRLILITQYSYGSILTEKDLSMMAVPDVTHFGPRYDFVVPNISVDFNTIVVIISESFSISGLLLDNQIFNPIQTVSVNVPGNGIYQVLYGNIPVGYHQLKHTDGNRAMFGAWIYGAKQYAWNLGYT